MAFGEAAGEAAPEEAEGFELSLADAEGEVFSLSFDSDAGRAVT